MGFLMHCDNKGCGKDQEPLLDTQTNEVYCVECNRVINSVTHFAKVQMKTLGQIKRDEKQRQAFAVECASCKKKSAPVLTKEDRVQCSLCHTDITEKIAKPFLQVIKNYFKAQK